MLPKRAYTALPHFLLTFLESKDYTGIVVALLFDASAAVNNR